MSRSTDSAGMDEAVSALVDGELPRRDSARVLQKVSEDPALRARWRRYHALRAALAGEMVIPSRPDLARRISAAIRDEEEITRPAWRRVSHLRSGLRARAGTIGLAGLAAVLTAAALLAVPERADPPARMVADSTDPVMTIAEADDESHSRADPLAASLTDAEPLPVTPELQQRFGMYLVTHAEYSASGDLPGVMPYSRVAGYSVDR